MKKNVNIILAIVLGMFVLMAIAMWYFAPNIFPNNDYPYYGHMMGGWGMPFGMIGMGLFWIGALYLIINGFGYRVERRDHSAIETLKNRLAKGEITIEEYEQLINKIKEMK